MVKKLAVTVAFIVIIALLIGIFTDGTIRDMLDIVWRWVFSTMGVDDIGSPFGS